MLDFETKTMSLPNFHFDFVKKENPAIFEFLKHDLARLEKESLRPEDIIPPTGKCREDDYANAFLYHVGTHPENYPWFKSKQSCIAVIQSMIREYRFLLAYMHAGQKTFCFSEGLSEKLCYASLKGLCTDLTLPNGAIAMVFNSDLAVEAYSAFKGSPAKAGSTITVYLKEDNLKQFGFRRLLLSMYESSGNTMLSSISRQLAMKSDWTLEQSLFTDWEHPENKGTGITMPPTPFKMTNHGKGRISTKEKGMGEFIEDSLQFLRLVLNAATYLNSPDADLLDVTRAANPTCSAHEFTFAGESVPGFFDLV